MKDRNVRLVSALHRVAMRATRGRLGRTLPGVGAPMLLLTTAGRKSGDPHTVPLLYLRDGDDFVVIASFGGRDNAPAWYLNLAAHPEATIEVGRWSRIPVVAGDTTGRARAALWEKAVAAWPGYADYQARTNRVIPVVRLSPQRRQIVSK